MKKLIIFMGPSGVGKTDLANYLKSKHPEALSIEKKHILDNQDYYNTINKYLSISDFVIIDGHHVLKQERKELFKNIDVDNLYIVGIWVENSWGNILVNNGGKPPKEQVSYEDLVYLFGYRSSPDESEPFDDIVYLMVHSGMGMSKTQPYLTDVYTALDRI